MSRSQSYLEAVYRRPVSTQRWLQALVEAVRADVDGGLGLAAFSFAVGEDGTLATVATADCLERVRVDQLEALALTKAAEQVLHATLQGGSWALSVPFGHLDARVAADKRIVLLLIAVHPQSGATVIAVPGLSADNWSGRQRHQPERLAAHLACALRLRCLPEWRGADVAVGAERVERSHSALGTRELRRAAVAADESSTSLAHSSAGAADSAWRGLLAGDLRQVDSFEREGRRYIVASREGARVPRGAPTPRQCRMLAMRSAGHSLKSIAAELRCSISTVSSEIARALRLLGIPNVRELGVGEESPTMVGVEGQPAGQGAAARGGGEAYRQLLVAVPLHRGGAQ